MRVAFLIIAHDQPNHLAKLVTSLRCNWATLFIHIDKNSDILPFKKLIQENGNALFLNEDKRVSVNWGGYSMVEATLNLLYSSLKYDDFDRFCLLSGSDYPIRPLSFIRSTFDSDKEFIRIGRRLTESDNNQHLKNVRFRHFIDNPSKSSHLTNDELNTERKIYNKIPLYHGSQWWALSVKAIKFIIHYLNHNKEYIDFHKYTLCPDEIFFHSIIKSSPYAESIVHDFEDRDSWEGNNFGLEHGCHYVDWITKGISLPKVLDESDVKKILESRALFARKFKEKSSDCLIKQLVNKNEL